MLAAGYLRRSTNPFFAGQMMNRLRRRPLRYWSLNLVFACSLLAAVSNTFGEQSITVTTTNSKPAEFKANIDIGGRKLEMASYGQGTPTVIVEAGLSDHPVESGTWDTVVAAIAKTTRICVYDRAGLGNSQQKESISSTPAQHAQKETGIGNQWHGWGE
jgi:hypothetical protein